MARACLEPWRDMGIQQGSLTAEDQSGEMPRQPAQRRRHVEGALAKELNVSFLTR